MSNSERKNRGRQKVPMVRMTKQSNRLVTFSKRRSGLFKKASELCTLCGAQAVIVVFSPAKKVFSFGHPSVTDVVNRFLYGRGKRSGGQRAANALEENNDTDVAKVRAELALVNDGIEAERRRTKELRIAREAKGDIGPIENMRLENLVGLMDSLTLLKKNIVQLGQGVVQWGTGENSGEGQDGLFGGQPSLLRVSNPNPMDDGLQHPSLAMGSNGSMPNPMGGFVTPNVGQFDEAGPGPMAMAMANNFESYTSMLMGDSPTHASNDAYNPYGGGFGFGPGPSHY